MAYLKLRSSASAFCGRVGFSAGLRRLSGSAVEELDNEGAPVPSWVYWKLRSALSDAKARAADAEARKSKDASLSEDERKSLKDLATGWFPQAGKEIWQVIFELPQMKGFRQDMQILLSSKDMHLLVEKALTFHKEFHHSQHGGVRQRDSLIFVREHMRSSIRDVTVDHMHLEGFLKAMAKAINVNVSFVDKSDIIDDTDD